MMMVKESVVTVSVMQICGEKFVWMFGGVGCVVVGCGGKDVVWWCGREGVGWRGGVGKSGGILDGVGDG